MTLTAGQLVYTNVEKQHSPAGRDGYQVWMRSPDALGDGDEMALMTRLGDFESREVGDEPLERHLYFTLPSGRVVLARAVPLAETDKFNRTGRFYAHAVVLTPEVFRQLGNDPFAVLDQVMFQGSVEDGQKAGDPAKGRLPSLELEHREAKRDVGFSQERLGTVMPTLLRACGKDKPVLIGVTGAPSSVLRSARGCFAWLPPSLRLTCSFDTLSTGRSLTQVPFAIVGLPSAGPPRRYLNLVLFDPAGQSFTQVPPGSSLGSFEQWLLDQVKKSPEPPPLARSEAAFRLGANLDRGRVKPEELAEVDGSLFEEIACCDSGVPKVESLLRKRLDLDVGPVLSRVVFTLAYNWLRSEGLDGFRALGEPLSLPLLLRWLLNAYSQRSPDEVDFNTEVLALKDVLESTKGVDGDGVTLRKRLVLLYYRLGRKWSTLAKSLRDETILSDDIYRWFVEWALRDLPIRVTPGAGLTHEGVWCGPQIWCTRKNQTDDVHKLIAAILGVDPQEPHAEPLPRERWTWVMHHLLSLVDAEDA